MARADKFELELADQLAAALSNLQDASIAAKIGETDSSSIEDASVSQSAGLPAAQNFALALDNVLDFARRIPTNDEGHGDGPIHRGFVARLAEHGFQLPRGSTGSYAPVDIQVDEAGATLPLNLGLAPNLSD